MKSFLLVLLVIISLNTYAQNNATDSLRQLLNTELADTIRVIELTNLAYHYWYSNPDTSMILTQQSLALARKIGFIKGEASALYSLGAVFNVTGNYAKSLDYNLQALKLFESLQNQDGIIRTNLGFATFYSEMGDFKMSIGYLMKGKAVIESINDPILKNYVLLNLGLCYEKLNQLDSALIYLNQSYELAVRFDNKVLIYSALFGLGSIHYKMQKSEIGMAFYRQCLSMQKEGKDFDGFSETTFEIAELFKKAGQADSALHYARLAFDAANEGGFTKRILNASTFLSSYFKELHRIDSAYYYQGISIAAKDSLFNQEKVREVQNLIFTERIRQQEIEDAKTKAEEERKSNIQLLGIVTFILFFFGLLFVFSKKHVNPKIIKFLGLLGLLLLFEFISLFLHPYIAEFTQHKPIFMLLILVAIASMLVPVHHKLQGWVKEKLASKTVSA